MLEALDLETLSTARRPTQRPLARIFANRLKRALVALIITWSIWLIPDATR